ncbi:hypothetical protein ANN_05151 [Periplaneta americana]|uniref:Uncharacterized protein n=1 Tax=Periplaneta americana TaxID=6978 RepID=A0ABQ8TC13_PERAM|nr:hypothetical protein ANN_05151 [Periplaneta americana]
MEEVGTDVENKRHEYEEQKKEEEKEQRKKFTPPHVQNKMDDYIEPLAVWLVHRRHDRGTLPVNAETRPDSCTTEEEKELVGSLAEKKLPTEGFIGRNGEREKRYQVINDIKIYGSYEETKRKAEKTWVLNKNTCKQLAVFERKILRRIFGAIETVDGWRARYNNEIYELYKESDLEAHIRCQRLRWLGHVTRMETTRKVKIVFNNNPDGTRLRGRPRTRWWNCVRVDVNRLGIRNWRELAMDREGWKRAIEEVKAHLGCNTK